MTGVKTRVVDRVYIGNVNSIKRGHYKIYLNVYVTIFRCDWLYCCLDKYCEVEKKIKLHHETIGYVQKGGYSVINDE